MTVAEFVQWLLTFPDQGATVEVLTSEDAGGWEGGKRCRMKEFDPAKHVEYLDFRNNQFVKPTAAYYNKRTLFLGYEE